MSQHLNYIAGEWVQGKISIANKNPSDLSDVVGHYASGDEAATVGAIAAAKAAFPQWASATPQVRADFLDAIGSEILARKEEIGRLLSREEGKPLADGIGEVARAGQIFKFFAGEALRIEGSVNRIGESNLGDLDYTTAILFSKPGAFGPASIFNASLKAALVDPDAYNAFTTTAAAGVSVELSDRDTVSAGGEVMWSDVEDAFGKNKYLTVSLPIEYVRDTRDDKLNPTEGYRFLINAKPSYETYRERTTRELPVIRLRPQP